MCDLTVRCSLLQAVQGDGEKKHDSGKTGHLRECGSANVLVATKCKTIHAEAALPLSLTHTHTADSPRLLELELAASILFQHIVFLKKDWKPRIEPSEPNSAIHRSRTHFTSQFVLL